MWLPGKLVSRMSQVFRRPSPEKNKKKNSKALDNGDASFASSSSSDARSPGEGSLKKGTKERFRPPLVEGRAICDNNVLEYTAFPIQQQQQQQEKDVPEKASPANGNEDENLNERLKAEEKAADEKMGSPQIDRSPPAAAATALLAAGGGGGSGGAGSNNNSNTSSTSGRLQQPQQQQQPQEQVSPSTTNTNSENSRNQEEPEGEKLMNAFPQSDKPCSVFYAEGACFRVVFHSINHEIFFLLHVGNRRIMASALRLSVRLIPQGKRGIGVRFAADAAACQKKIGNSFPTLDFPFPFPCVAVVAVSFLRKEHEVLPLYFTLD